MIAGDAVVTLDPYAPSGGGRSSPGRPRPTARARDLASLDALAETGATTVLTGHGEAWKAGATEAVSRARQAGPS